MGLKSTGPVLGRAFLIGLRIGSVIWSIIFLIGFSEFIGNHDNIARMRMANQKI